MSGTYTPTQTWHATATYVLTGETITETVAQDLGTSAMDNIASLVGTAAGATPQAIRRIATVADVAALKAVAVADRADRDYVVLDDTKRVYQFDSSSAATGDDHAVVTPTAGTGRWLLTNAVPRYTHIRLVLPAAGMIPDPVSACSPDYNNAIASGYTSWANVSSGGNYVSGCFTGLNPGDVIDTIELAGNLTTDATAQVEASFYTMTCADGASSPTMAALGTTLTDPSATGNFVDTDSVAFTIPGDTSTAAVVVKVLMKNTGGVGSAARLYWVALRITRTYITQ